MSTETKPDHELAGIEVLRFVCAAAVLFWHYQHFFFIGRYDDAQSASIRAQFPFYGIFRLFYEHGDSAVDFFWVISGFIFFWRYSGSIAARKVSVLEFSRRRFSRLYPLHVATLGSVILLQAIYRSIHHVTFIYQDSIPLGLISQLFFASNWFCWQTLTFNGPVWSISAEILVYFLFYWVVRAFGAELLVALCGCAIGFGVYASSLSNAFLSAFVWLCGGLFFAGGVAQKLACHRLALPLAVCCGTATIVFLSLGTLHYNDATIGMLAISAVLSLSNVGEKLNAILRRMAFLGNATYASYLLHFPLQLAIVTAVDLIGYDRRIFFAPAALVAYLAVVIVTSLAVHRWFEMPAQRLLRGLPSVKTVSAQGV